MPINFPQSCLRDTSSYKESHLLLKINKFWNIKNICSECIFILFAQVRNPVLRRFANFLKVNQYLFWFWFELAWFVPISWFLVKTMGVGTNCPDIKDKWVISYWVQYGNTTHTWLTIGRRLYPWRVSDLTQSGYGLAGQSSVGQAYLQDLNFTTFYWEVCRSVDGPKVFNFYQMRKQRKLLIHASTNWYPYGCQLVRELIHDTLFTIQPPTKLVAVRKMCTLYP